MSLCGPLARDARKKQGAVRCEGAPELGPPPTPDSAVLSRWPAGRQDTHAAPQRGHATAG